MKQVIKNVEKSNEKSISSFFQLTISKMISQQHCFVFTFPLYQIQYIGNDKFKFELMRSKNYASSDENVSMQNNSVININVTQRREKRKNKKLNCLNYFNCFRSTRFRLML